VQELIISKTIVIIIIREVIMKKFIVFIMGIGIGAVLVSLLSPAPGKEIRKKIKVTLKKPDVREKIAKIKDIYSKFQVD
jgi:hypothetical protein